jgi:hypothetical protein
LSDGERARSGPMRANVIRGHFGDANYSTAGGCQAGQAPERRGTHAEASMRFVDVYQRQIAYLGAALFLVMFWSAFAAIALWVML